MSIQIFNTLSRSKEEFKPIVPGEVRMYVCGPTVYNLIHIGNARPMIVFDTVRRYFEYKGYKVNYVSNFTDVDDKIIRKAQEENVPAEVISERYIAECRKDMESLSVREATTHPQATREIDGMIEMISTLIDKGYAYVAADGTVYYRTLKFRDYGKLSHKDLTNMRSGFRQLQVTGADQKEDPLDFVLWKPKKEGEPYWESPWCKGRPGWHIECSVMSRRYLGQQIDIHAGGEDLIFPHHENEIAQSEAANGVPFARYWMHNAFLNIDGAKMSKSAGNFFLVRDVVAQYDPQVIRYFMLSVHYRRPLNWAEEFVAASQVAYEKILNCGDNLKFLLGSAGGALSAEEEAMLAEAEAYRRSFEEAMDDDFNTADAITALLELVKWINSHVNGESSREFLEKVQYLFEELAGVLGLETERDDALEEDLASYVEARIEERKAAKKARDYALADKIRDELKSRGILLEDTREGVKWKKI